MSSSLPSGWVECMIGEISTVVGGGTPDASDPLNFSHDAGIAWLTPADLSKYDDTYIARGSRFLTPQGFKGSSAKLMPKGTVLFSSRAPIGYVAIASSEIATNQGFKSFICNTGILPEYLYFYLKFAKHLAEGLASGTTFPEISGKNAARIPVRLAPTDEQERIATKLANVRRKVDGCNRRLERIPTILKRFRRSVLAAACSGRLTADWREQHPAGDQNGSTRVGFDNDFPEMWRPTHLGKLASLVTSGSRGWAKYYADTGSTFIRAQNINSDVLNLDDVAFVQLPNRAEGVRTKVHRNDILVTITGANVTKAALVDVDLEDAYISQHVALVRFHEPSSAAFLFLWIVSPSHGRRQLQDAAYGQGKPGLNLDNIRDVDVMMPPVDEQIEIVRRVESLFTLADQLEARYKKGKAYVDKLTQSILAKAFRGELVPQDPNDEPAEKLLERIRTRDEPAKKGR